MTDADDKEVFGTAEPSESGKDRQLVTFALIAYNQEAYIREAVEGAFAQTYSPLEIILSDDCSPDRTFEIMREMAAAYPGPHRVVVRRNTINLRPYSHVLAAVKECEGSLVVLAAGDDVSKPDRTSKIVEASMTSDAWAFHSRYDVIDESGAVMSLCERSEDLFSPYSEFHKYFDKEDGPVSVVHGATSAYRKELIDLAPDDHSGILSEDGVFSILLTMLGQKAIFLDESLVLYRSHAQAISNSIVDMRNADFQACRAILKKQELYAKNIADRLVLALRFQADFGNQVRQLNDRYVRTEIVIQNGKYAWPSLTLQERLHLILASIRHGRIGYIIPSILGQDFGPRYLSWRASFFEHLGIRR